MEIELRKFDDENLEFVISGTNPAFVNSIRRTILQKVPVMAIDEVEVMVNDTIMGDEVIAHRLGQIPLNTPDGYLLPSECDCRKGRCPNCSVDLDLELVEGPAVVRASDLDPSDSEVFPVQGETPIVRLGEEQRIKLTGIARLGFGKDHANWQPAVASYKYMPIININQDAREEWEECAEVCPTDVFEVEDGELTIVNLEECTLCNACVEACPGAIEVKGDSTKFIFRVESTGAMSSERILRKSLEIMKAKCSEFNEKLDELKKFGEL